MRRGQAVPGGISASSSAAFGEVASRSSRSPGSQALKCVDSTPGDLSHAIRTIVETHHHVFVADKAFWINRETEA